ncbi:MAG: Transcriptional regulatory protein DegU [Proteobacteria bacterium]|jgi:two-component system nitrate/nitrite response regulator NarL|nr:MAG: Transcriptional regulatory protein DegU [Pseudomonadota bacterium]
MEMNNKKFTVAIVDDHEIIREGISELIDKTKFNVVGSFSSGQEIKDFMNAGHHVDVILMDITMPEENGINVAKEIIARHKNVKVVMLTMSESLEDIKNSAKVGVKGFLTKTASADKISHAISMVMQGDVVFPSKIYDVDNIDIFTNSRGKGKDVLSRREVEILKYIAKGHSNKEIAYELNLAEGTVKVHVKKILTKLGLQNRTQGAIYAINKGWGPTAEEINQIISPKA